jgi:hypothetical protein
MDKFAESYITAGALSHFGMKSFDDMPTQNMQDVSDIIEEKRNFILQESLQFVKDNFRCTAPDLKKDAPRSNTLKCIYCQKQYKHVKSLKKHEIQHHSHPEPENEEPLKSDDQVLTYTKKVVTLMLLREEHNDALHMNDGDRIMRVNRFLTLIYKESKCPKYAYGMLETACQQAIFLPARLAYQIKWNRTVNHRGEVNSNFPLDLDMEHDNGLFKDQIRTYRGDFTEKAIQRVSRSTRTTEEILTNLDKVSHVSKPRGKHTKLDTQKDILDLAAQLHKKQLFTEKSKRNHKGFENVPQLLSTLTHSNVSDWIGKTLKSLKRKHYYLQFELD